MLTIVLIGLCILLLVILYRHVEKSGFFDKIQVEVIERPQLIGQNLEIFYKYHVGSYSRSSNHTNEVKSLVANPNAKIVSIYYDNPKEVKDELCQMISGVVYSINDAVLIEPHFATNLTRWGYERVRLPIVEKSVVCKQRFSGVFSHLHLIWHVYPKINKFFKDQRFECQLTIEVLGDSCLTVFCPLDHTEDFKVPEVIPTDKLEEKLAISEFQTSGDESIDLSDEDSSSFYNDDEELIDNEASALLDA